MQRVRREDTVLVVKGKDRGRSGSVRKVIPDKKKVIITGINIVEAPHAPSRSAAAGRHHRARGPNRLGQRGSHLPGL